MLKFLQNSWHNCWQAIGGAGDGQSLLQELLAAYRQPQRHYHTLQHLHECLMLLENHRALAIEPAEIEIALWFHDAVYDPAAKDNEARSAAWAAQALTAAGVSQELIGNVIKLIMASCHTAVPENPDQQLLVDIDLAILGAERSRFIEYEAQIRAEYAMVPESLFREKRAAILQTFLTRPCIYSTPAIRQRLEPVARANLNEALSGLGQFVFS